MKNSEAYHFCCFCSSDRKFHVGIFLPITEEEGESGEESIIDVSSRRDSLRARVAVETTLEGFGGTHQLLPVLKVIGVLEL